MTDPLLPS